MKLKGIDGDPHKQRSMWFNSRLREEPYQDLTYQGKFLEIKTLDLSTLDTGGAWLSSARVVRCWVKSRNERNPYIYLLTGSAEDSRWTADDKSEEGGDDVKSSCPLCPGLHTCYNGRYKEKLNSDIKQTSKNRSQFGLISATRDHEAGVASNRRSECCGECVPGSCTHRPSHHGSW